MPILSFSMRSQDIDNDENHTSQPVIKTINLADTYKMKYLKLLHIFHNINFTQIHDEDSTSQATNTILFAKFSFLNSNQAVFFEGPRNAPITHNGLVCLGETVAKEHETTFRDAYKVLHSKGILYINAPFTVELFQLRSNDPSATNESLSTYNANTSHLIEAISADQFRGAINSAGQFITFVFEYEEDESK